MTRIQIIQNLRNKRYTYQQIGDLLNVSRQRVHQILTEYNSPIIIKPFTQIPVNWQPDKKYNSKGLKKAGFEGRGYLKEIVRRRDNYTCQICNRKWRKGQRRFDIHHLDENLEGRNGYSYKACKNLDRQITLCHKCHLNLKNVRMKLIRSHKKVIHS